MYNCSQLGLHVAQLFLTAQRSCQNPSGWIKPDNNIFDNADP